MIFANKTDHIITSSKKSYPTTINQYPARSADTPLISLTLVSGFVLSYFLYIHIQVLEHDYPGSLAGFLVRGPPQNP